MINLPFSLRILLGVAYIVIGVYTIINKDLIADIPPIMIVVFGVACILYGVFRIYRATRNV